MAEEEKNQDDKLSQNFYYATWLIKVIAIIIGVIIFIFSRNAFIFFSAAMLPSIIIIFIDKANHKCLSATIFTFNIIGLLPFFKMMWSSSVIDSAAKNIIADPFSWIIVYSATTIGVIIYYVLPAIISHIYVTRANLKIKQLINERDRIAFDWQIEVQTIESKFF